jgi:hypothetical protein
LVVVEQVFQTAHLVKEHQELIQYYLELHLLVVVEEDLMEVFQEQMVDQVVEVEQQVQVEQVILLQLVHLKEITEEVFLIQVLVAQVVVVLVLLVLQIL